MLIRILVYSSLANMIEESGGILNALYIYDVHFSLLETACWIQPHEFQPEFDIACSSRVLLGVA